MSLLSDRVSSERLIVVDSLSVESGKTKDMVAVLKKLGIETQGALVVMPERDEMVWRSMGNIPKALPLPVEGMNVYDIARHGYLVSTVDGLASIEKRLRGSQQAD